MGHSGGRERGSGGGRDEDWQEVLAKKAFSWKEQLLGRAMSTFLLLEVCY